ncbi:MAG TPA: hypothetical protein VKA26_12375, partial [Ignavibacteriaceae bacterium]|nr:hypothetical protein [Ignavibacteriaceae bacterium]
RVGGPYQVTFSYVGYQKQTQDIDKLNLGQNYSLDIQLTETTIELSNVVVSGNRGAVINENRTGSAQNVSTKQIEELPTINRSFASFAKMSPMFSGLGYQAAGRSNRYNNIQIDGTQYNDLFGLTSSGTPGGQAGTNPISLDALQEFQVVIAPYDVRLGGFTAGGLNAITRSGTNEFHGSVYGFGRNNDLVGKKYEGMDQPVNEFKEWQYGVRLGGPIIKDKVFFFVNGEITGRNEPITNLSLSTAGVADSADAIRSILAGRGFATGGYAPFTTKQPSGKLFARMDFNLSENQKLNVHYNYVNAKQDVLGNRSASNRFSFDSYNYQFHNITNNFVVQLNSTFGNSMANEFIAGYTTIRDKRGPEGTLLPALQIDEAGGFRYYAGTDQYSSANSLDQDIFEITDNFTYYAGDHTFTVGTHNEFFSFKNLFLRNFAGFWEYYSVDDLRQGNPGYYSRVVPLVGDGSAEFKVNQFGFYAQDEWQVMPNFRLSFGVRVDIPVFPDKPLANDSVSAYFPGITTASAPSGNLLWAPRVGFNWDVNGDKTTQVRGGVGIFTGRPAYVWISNQYGNSGNTQAEVRGASGQGTLLQFSPDANNQPGFGDPGTTPGSRTAEIDLSDPNLKMPQVLRFDLGVDHQLPLGFIGTVEFQYTKAVNDFVYEKLNLNPQTSTIMEDGRPYFGGTDGKNGNFYDVLWLKNTNEGYSYNLSFQAQRNVARGISINAGYTLGRAKDLNSVASSQARSQMRYSPVAGNPNNPVLATSLYEIRNRIFASVTYTEEFFENAPTTISVFYNGENGAPYSFIYYGDVNNDGFDQNDLFYIPKDNSEILLGSVSGGVYTPDPNMYTAFNSFVDNNDYLSSHKGQIAERNAATNPWVNYVDIHISQDIPIISGHRFTINYDILNLMNLINSDWGWNSSIFSTYTIVSKKGTVTAAGPNQGRNVYSFSAPSNNTPFTASNFSSRWQMQLGVRYSF